MTVKLDGATLGIQDVVRVARRDAQGSYAQAALAPEARERIAATRDYIDRTWMHDDAPLMYAFNTGVGLFKDQRVLISDMAAYQRKTVYAHATGVGEPFAEDVTRAMMLLRANAFASNYSGPQVELVERLIAFLNAGLHPVIPQKGSVGASGDLAPLAHMAGAVCGFDEADMIYQGRVMPARDAIRLAGFDPDFELGAKDASALINGSTTSLALGVLAANDARRLLKHADIAMALSLQAMRFLAIAMTDLGAIAERRLARLIDPTMSYGLPRNLLAGKRGLNTGFATVQCSMSALVMENRGLSTPGSVDSIPGKSNAEDHVSNSTWCGRKARTIVENVEQIVAGELLMAAQALTLVEPVAGEYPLGKGSRAAMDAIRAVIPPAIEGDRWYATEMRQALDLVHSGAVVEAVESAVGALE